ncbi:MAG TPA: hypothetical protein VGF08_00210 [Terriglobales bacterium]|jgi:hypothetical protein
MLRFPLFLLISLLLPVGLLYAEATSSELNDARAAVRRNLQTPEGTLYDADISEEFPEQYRRSLQQCTENTPEKELANFEVFMNVGGDGAVRRALVSPETQVALCLRQEVLKGSFSAPPKPGYWVRIELRLKD